MGRGCPPDTGRVEKRSHSSWFQSQSSGCSGEGAGTGWEGSRRTPVWAELLT